MAQIKGEEKYEVSPQMQWPEVAGFPVRWVLYVMSVRATRHMLFAAIS